MSRSSSFQAAARSFAAAFGRGSSAGSCTAPVSRACAAIQTVVNAKITSRAISASHPVLQAWRQEQFSGTPGFGTFAAGPVGPQPPAPAAVSNVQVRGASSTSVSDDADEEAASSTTGPRPRTRRSSGGTAVNDDDDPLPLNRFAKGRMRQKSQTFGEWAAEARASSSKQQRDVVEMTSLDQTNPLEFKLIAQESFLKKPTEVISIPADIREVLYRFNWDKVIVDVRSSTTSSDRGKTQVYTAMVAVGNLSGLFGLGLADAPVAMDAVGKAYMEAFSKLTFIPLYRGHTIYHRIDHDFHRMKMRLMPRHDGWGVKASDLVSELCGLVGIKNISIKMFGRSKNKFYVAQCFQEALSLQSTAHDGVEGTGIYVREVCHQPRGDQAAPMQKRVRAQGGLAT